MMPALRVICCWLGETLRTLRLSRRLRVRLGLGLGLGLGLALRLSRRLVCGLLGRSGDELITRRAASLIAWHT